jgi:hypothetical protein
LDRAGTFQELAVRERFERLVRSRLAARGLHF